MPSSFCEAAQQTEAVVPSSKGCRYKPESFLEKYLDPNLLVFNVPVLAPREEIPNEVLEKTSKLIQKVEKQLCDVKNNDKLVKLLHAAPYTSQTQFVNSDESQLYVKQLVNTKMQELMDPKLPELVLAGQLDSNNMSKNESGVIQTRCGASIQRDSSKGGISQTCSEIYTQKKAAHPREIARGAKHASVRAKPSKELVGDGHVNSKQTEIKINQVASQSVSACTGRVYGGGVSKKAPIVQKNLGRTSTSFSAKTEDVYQRVEIVGNTKQRSVVKSVIGEEDCPCPICSYEKQHNEIPLCKKHPLVKTDKNTMNDMQQQKSCINKEKPGKNETGSKVTKSNIQKYALKSRSSKPVSRSDNKSSDTTQTRRSQNNARRHSIEQESVRHLPGASRSKEEEKWADILNTGVPSSIMQSVLSLFSENARNKEASCSGSSPQRQSGVRCPVHDRPPRPAAGTLVTRRARPASKDRGVAHRLQKEVSFLVAERARKHTCSHCGKTKKCTAVHETGEDPRRVPRRDNSDRLVASSASSGSVEDGFVAPAPEERTAVSAEEPEPLHQCDTEVEKQGGGYVTKLPESVSSQRAGPEEERGLGRPAALCVSSRASDQQTQSSLTKPPHSSPIDEILRMLEDVDSGNLSGQLDADAALSQMLLMQPPQVTQAVQRYDHDAQTKLGSSRKDDEAVDIEYEEDWEAEPEGEEETEREEEKDKAPSHETDASSDIPGSRGEHVMLGTSAPDLKSGKILDAENGSLPEDDISSGGSCPSEPATPADVASVHLEPPTTSASSSMSLAGGRETAAQSQKHRELDNKVAAGPEACVPSRATVVTTSHVRPLPAPRVSSPATQTDFSVVPVRTEGHVHGLEDNSQPVSPLKDFACYENSSSSPAVIDGHATLQHFYPGDVPQTTVPGRTVGSLYPPQMPPLSYPAPNMASQGHMSPAALYVPVHQVPYFVAAPSVQSERQTDGALRQLSNLLEDLRTAGAVPKPKCATVSTCTSPPHSCSQHHGTDETASLQPTHVPNVPVHSRSLCLDQPSAAVGAVNENPFPQSFVSGPVTSTVHPGQVCSDKIALAASKGVQANIGSVLTKGVQVCDSPDEARQFRERVKSSCSAMTAARRRREACRPHAVPSPIVEAASEDTSTSDQSGPSRRTQSSTSTDVTPSYSDLSEGEVCVTSGDVSRLAPSPAGSPGEVSHCGCSEGELCSHKQQAYCLSLGELQLHRGLGRLIVSTSMTSSASDVTQLSSFTEIQSSSLGSSCADTAFDSVDMVLEQLS